VRIDWSHGVVFARPTRCSTALQHLARSGALSRGGVRRLRYPFTESKKHVFMGMDVKVQDGGCQIEYEDQDRRVHEIFLKELAKTGAKSKMASSSTRACIRRQRLRRSLSRDC